MGRKGTSATSTHLEAAMAVLSKLDLRRARIPDPPRPCKKKAQEEERQREVTKPLKTAHYQRAKLSPLKQSPLLQFWIGQSIPSGAFSSERPKHVSFFCTGHSSQPVPGTLLPLVPWKQESLTGLLDGPLMILKTKSFG